MGCKRYIRCRNDHRQRWICLQQRAKRFAIQVIGVVMARGDDINKIEPLGQKRNRRHAHMGLGGVGILLRE